MDCADYRIHSDCTADSTGYDLLYGLSPDSVTIRGCVNFDTPSCCAIIVYMALTDSKALYHFRHNGHSILYLHNSCSFRHLQHYLYQVYSNYHMDAQDQSH